MSEPEYVTKDDVQDMIVKALDRYTQALKVELEQVRDDAKSSLSASLENTVKYGESVALQADKGLFLCAEEGGPTQDKDPFTLSGRSSVGPWESWSVVRGQ